MDTSVFSDVSLDNSNFQSCGGDFESDTAAEEELNGPELWYRSVLLSHEEGEEKVSQRGQQPPPHPQQQSNNKYDVSTTPSSPSSDGTFIAPATHHSDTSYYTTSVDTTCSPYYSTKESPVNTSRFHSDDSNNGYADYGQCSSALQQGALQQGAVQPVYHHVSSSDGDDIISNKSNDLNREHEEIEQQFSTEKDLCNKGRITSPTTRKAALPPRNPGYDSPEIQCHSEHDLSRSCNSKGVGKMVANLDQHSPCKPSLEKRQSSTSIVDGLLFELYDKHHVSAYSNNRSRFNSIDGSSTDCSSFSEGAQFMRSDSDVANYSSIALLNKDVDELREICSDLTNKVSQKNALLVRYLRNRERNRSKESKHCDVITATLQALSLKTSTDSKMRFSREPQPGGDNFMQWRQAMVAVVRRSIGIPDHFRRKMWGSLATHYLHKLHLDWDKILQFAFNDKSNPDDDTLGLQIVKDLHRTGLSSFSGIENEEDRAILQRVLLGYARWNKVTGYCQGFNILAASILGVTEKNEADALQVMVYLIDNMLPKEYFAHNLRALTVDMAVFRSYLSMKLPRLSAHLTRLQEDARDISTGASVEPPLTNVFTMQWFLTLFANCLPEKTVLKVWDCIMLDGSEILIRTALAIWTKLAKKIIKVSSADEFYMVMGSLTKSLMEGSIISADELIRSIYKMAPVPLPKLDELREEYMYDITPFSAAMNSASQKPDLDETDALQELTTPNDNSRSYQTTDIGLLRKQYAKLKARQRQAQLQMRVAHVDNDIPIQPRSIAPVAMNHLFVGKQVASQAKSKGKKSSADGSSIQAKCPSLKDEISIKLNLYAESPQSKQPGYRYKYRSQKIKEKSPELTESQRLEQALAQRLSEEKTSADHDSLRVEDHSSETSEEPLSPASDHSSIKISNNNFEIFHQPEVPFDQPHYNDVFDSDESEPSSEPQSPTKAEPPRRNSGNHSALMSYCRPPPKPFNPFPRSPATSLLSAQKARNGIKLGMYKPADALAYMNPMQKKKLLENRQLEHRMAKTNNLW